jgi:hypothetical protein
MTGMEHKAEAARVYRRVLHEVGASQAVAAAEDIITDAWIAELDSVRRDVVHSADRVRGADRVAREVMGRAQRERDPAGIAHAQLRFAESSLTSKCELDLLHVLLDSVDAAIEQACFAGTQRARLGREDLARLRVAWSEAYG